ncbi:hypothetical protein GOB93_03285 [Acetobacter musti]|uniref:Uncharacterized protein n=1 Tax=Acetobacter musti TaxID=864732 RepID=A0ABX0JJC7_9PROT|nr:hypothetical protein [Acetobacter musti]NHN83663.1 hypothetical protein [Acetobacter musti]
MTGAAGPFDWSGLVLGPCQNVFGENVTWYHRRAPAGVTVRGIFDEGFQAYDAIGGEDGMEPVHLSSSHPILGIRIADFPSLPVQGDRFLIRGIPYRVQEVRPDSHGAASLILNKADRENGSVSCASS